MKEIKLVGIDVEGVTEPRDDGTQGSALYEVPIILSETPSQEWTAFFEQAYGLPRNASVVNNRIVVKRATIEQVARDDEKARLVAAVKQANEQAQEYWTQREKDKEQQRQGSLEFRKHIAEVSDKIKFD